MDKSKKSAALYITQSAVTAALYVVLTMVFQPISFGPMQVRISEVLTVLPMFSNAAVPGLFIGCVLANTLGGAVIWDIIFGSLATLVGAAVSYLLRKNRWLVPLPPVIANAAAVPFILRYGYGMDIPIPETAMYVALGEIIGCYILGELLITALLKRSELFRNKK